MTISVDLLFRILAFIIFFLWWLYWRVTESEANHAKPKVNATGSVLMHQRLQWWILSMAQVTLVLQLFGFPLFELPGKPFVIQAIGLIFVLLGVGICISARKTLGTNWSHAIEYQVKKKQELVTSGVYRFIRHPIYAGFCLAFIGGELIAHSYLAFVAVLFFVVGYYQSRREEKLLISHFGNAYKTYMKRTKMFIPFLW